MEFCAIICEYNPFHNGHLYLMREAERLSGRSVLCVMSGNFTQRGEAAIMDKYRRARHAVENGAKIVLELPAPFAVSPAELFARGAVSVLASFSAVKSLAFGCESGNAESFLAAAQATFAEDKAFKAAIKEKMKDGTSYIRARTQTAISLHPEIDERIFLSPNNILGLEYARAMLAAERSLVLFPVKRTGADHHESRPRENFSSATALRACIAENGFRSRRVLRGNLPENVCADLRERPPRPVPYAQAALCALLRSEPEEIALTADCSEGLENRLLALAKSNDYDGILHKCVSKRYTLSRIKRIILQNFLKISLKETKEYLVNPLYGNVLAVNKAQAGEIFSSLADGFPLLVRGSDSSALKKTAAACRAADVRAENLYRALTGGHRETETLFI